MIGLGLGVTRLGGGTGVATPFPGAAEVLDFVTGYYRVEAGTVFASAADAGWTGTGTFDGAGYTATGTDVLTKTIDFPGDFIVFAEFVQPSTAANRQLWRHTGLGTPQVMRLTTGEYLEIPAAAGTSSSVTRIASGRSGGNGKVSFGNAAVTTGAAASIPGSANFRIGNTASPFDVPFSAAIARIVIYKATLSDAEIQALGA